MHAGLLQCTLKTAAEPLLLPSSLALTCTGGQLVGSSHTLHKSVAAQLAGAGSKAVADGLGAGAACRVQRRTGTRTQGEANNYRVIPNGPDS